MTHATALRGLLAEQRVLAVVRAATIADPVALCAALAEGGIHVHVQEMTKGQTYAQLSAKSMADPKNQELAGLVATVFKGETLRGMLLNAYAFGQMAVIALWGSVAAFAGAAVLLLLSLAGAVHLRRTPVEEEVRMGIKAEPATA